MDQFAEQLVKKITTSKDDMKKGVLILGAVLLVLFSLYLTFFVAPIAVVLPVGIVYLAIYLLKLQNVEYEYSCTNGTLDIDKIMGQSKRVEMLTIEVSAFTLFGKESNCVPSHDEMTTFSALGISMMDTAEETETYYAEFDHPDFGKCCLYFSPDKKMRAAITPFLQRSVRNAMM